jgi:hypothetical protein
MPFGRVFAATSLSLWTVRASMTARPVRIGKFSFGPGTGGRAGWEDASCYGTVCSNFCQESRSWDQYLELICRANLSLISFYASMGNHYPITHLHCCHTFTFSFSPTMSAIVRVSSIQIFKFVIATECSSAFSSAFSQPSVVSTLQINTDSFLTYMDPGNTFPI